MTADIFSPPDIEMTRRDDGSIELASRAPLTGYPRSIGVWLERWATEKPDGVFLAERPDGDYTRPWRTITYGEMWDSARAMGQALLDAGLGADRAVRATVKLVATNLNGQRLDLRAREVREGEAVYYLAEARITGQDTLVFELEVTPEGSPAPIKASFRQEFFAQ